MIKRAIIISPSQVLTFVQRMYVYFSSSPKRYAGLLASAAACKVRLYALQQAGDTRWLAHRDSVSSVLKDMTPLLDRLITLDANHDAEATSLLGEFTEAETLVNMYLAMPLLDGLGALNKTMQVP